MAKSLYDAVTEIAPFNMDPQEIMTLREKINLRKDDLWNIFLEHRNNPVVRNVIEGNLTFAGQLDDTLEGIIKDYNKNKIALSSCLDQGIPYRTWEYVVGGGLFGGLLFGVISSFIAMGKSGIVSYQGEGNFTRRDFLNIAPVVIPLAVLGFFAGGVLGYANHEAQADTLSHRARYLDMVYRLVK